MFIPPFFSSTKRINPYYSSPHSAFHSLEVTHKDNVSLNAVERQSQPEGRLNLAKMLLPTTCWMYCLEFLSTPNFEGSNKLKNKVYIYTLYIYTHTYERPRMQWFPCSRFRPRHNEDFSCRNVGPLWPRVARLDTKNGLYLAWLSRVKNSKLWKGQHIIGYMVSWNEYVVYVKKKKENEFADMPAKDAPHCLKSSKSRSWPLWRFTGPQNVHMNHKSRTQNLSLLVVSSSSAGEDGVFCGSSVNWTLIEQKCEKTIPRTSPVGLHCFIPERGVDIFFEIFAKLTRLERRNKSWFSWNGW